MTEIVKGLRENPAQVFGERESSSPRKILIEANKISEGSRDGCFRYTVELLRAIEGEVSNEPGRWQIEVLVRGKLYPIARIQELLRYDWSRTSEYERKMVNRLVLLRQSLANSLRRHLPRKIVDAALRIDQRIGMTRGLEKKHVGSPFDPRNHDLVHLALPQAYRSFLPDFDCPLVVTIHDCTHLRFPQFHLRANVEETEKGIQFALARGAQFLSVSDSSRSDLIKDYGVAPEQVVTTHLATDPNRFRPVEDPSLVRATLQEYGVTDGPYFLALSTLEPRKNLPNVIRAFSEFRKRTGSPAQLVVAGRKGWKYDDIFKDPAASSDGICFTGFLREKDLPILYSGALALVFASYYEGFGLPALESMACGTGVIFGKNGALPEVVGAAGIPADPADSLDIALAMERLHDNRALRKELRNLALKRAAGFSWSSTAQKTLETYEQTLERHAVGG